MLSAQRLRSLVFLTVLGLSGCATPPTPTLPAIATRAPTNTAPAVIVPTLPPAWTPTQVKTATPTLPPPTSTAPPTNTPLPTETFTPVPPTATPPPWPVLAPQERIAHIDHLHNIFAFVSKEGLQTISADGKRAGLLASSDPDPNLHWTFVTKNPPYLLFIANDPNGPFEENDWFRRIPTPTECGPEGNPPLNCSNYAISPDGRWVVFTTGQGSCGNPAGILNVSTGKMRTLFEGGVHNFQFTNNGKLLMALGHCEGGTYNLVDPATGIQQMLGEMGSQGQFWNPQHTAMAIAASPYQGWGESVWGYNLDSGRRFTSDNWGQAEYNQPLWAPDGVSLLYTQRPGTYNSSADRYQFKYRRIGIVNSNTGQNRTLLVDPAYDFHLCGEWNRNCEWIGDWLLVRRVAYQFADQIFPFNPDGNEPNYQCLGYGVECAAPVEFFGLNWRTGESKPWEELQSSEATPTSTPAPTPDLNKTKALYSDPSGLYAFYLTKDGRSLWLVPKDNAPVLWTEGSNFVYVP